MCGPPVAAGSTALTAARHGREALQQVHVLFVLQQRAGHHRHCGGGVRVDLGGRGVFGQQQAQPIQQFGRGRLFLQARCVAQREERVQCGS
ncbi:hypothetical protein G6F62_015491 [Rhizopus arrhizus]|nr:hypothetical protein G6F62_015491 [Rhizopus arrhizus]